MTIPKIIHYIWLGGKPLPKIAKKCINTWKKVCPDYEIKRWDETNLDLDDQYVKDAIEAKKFAFASDAIRFKILQEYGGIYLDIDVELIKPIDEFLSQPLFMCFENDKYVAPGLICGCEPNNDIINKINDYYRSAKFDCTDLTKMVTVCKVVTDILIEQGLKEKNETQNFDWGTIYASEYFCPKNMSDGRVVVTNNTYSIHHYLGSWSTPWFRFKNKVRQIVKRILGKRLVAKIKARKNKEVAK